jgi:hypothetical protein
MYLHLGGFECGQVLSPAALTRPGMEKSASAEDPKSQSNWARRTQQISSAVARLEYEKLKQGGLGPHSPYYS